MQSKPLVSVIIPCYNEEHTISSLLTALMTQTYPSQKIEVIVADGQSTDGTRDQINAFQTAHPELHLTIVDNPRRNIPAALNRAIAAARGEIIARMDAHAIPQPDYIERCVQNLQRQCGDNVGGVIETRPLTDTWLARGIAIAVSHPLGVGNAYFRVGSVSARAVDTVPFGTFRRDLVDQIGGFDERLLVNEDYEFNARILKNGGTVWLDPNIRSVYYARSHLSGLIRQYVRYGYWKVCMLRRYPRTIRWRQAIPPLFVASLIVLSVGAWFWLVARLALLLQISLYGLILLAVGMKIALQRRDMAAAVAVPLAMITLHLSWGSGFLWSLLTSHD